MDDTREFDSVMMNIQRYGGGIASLAFLPARMSLKLLTYIMRLAKKGMVALGAADQFKNFSKSTEGKFTVYNIPLNKERAKIMNQLQSLELELQNESNSVKKAGIRNEIKKLQSEVPELEQLKRLNIQFCALPKLNGSDQTIQIAVSKQDDQIFKNWYLNHLTSAMKGGQMSMEEMRVFTEGNYTIFNLPMEGKEFQTALVDFNTLGVNYSVLPDLNIGDNNSQIAISNADKNKFEVWVKMWRDQQIKEGKVPSEVYEMNQDSYMNTGTLTADDYIKNSDPDYQEANKEFEENGINTPWEAKLAKENSEEYVKLLNDDNYEKITINKETLVENMVIDAKSASMRKNGYFISRVPGTYGNKQQTLILPVNQVFTTDEGKTYIAFLPKNNTTMVADSSGNIQKKRFEEAYAPYDKVQRGFNRVKEIKMDKNLSQNVPVPDMKQSVPAVAAATPVTPKL